MAVNEYCRTGKLILEDWMKEFIMYPEIRFIRIWNNGKYLFDVNGCDIKGDYVNIE